MCLCKQGYSALSDFGCYRTMHGEPYIQNVGTNIQSTISIKCYCLVNHKFDKEHLDTNDGWKISVEGGKGANKPQWHVFIYTELLLDSL